MTSFSVYLLSGAKQDLLRLHRYVAAGDSLENADKLIDDLLKNV